MVGLSTLAVAGHLVIDGIPNFFSPTKDVLKQNCVQALEILRVRGTRASYVTTDDTVWAKIFEPALLQCV